MQLTLKSKTVRYHLISTVLILILGAAFGMVLCSSCWNNRAFAIMVTTNSAATWLVLWKGNEALGHYMDVWVDWRTEAMKRLLLGISGHIVYTVAAVFLVNYLSSILFGWSRRMVSWEGLIELSWSAILITIFIASIFTARDFFLSWRQTAVEKERVQKELITSKYEALRNQVNPHFLFNSLNVLTALVYKDADQSAAFIKKLSEVYRYVLDVRDKTLVDLDEELDFLQAFGYLLHMRHSDGLNLNLAVGDPQGIRVAPLALQMLVENAVKHNRIHRDEPLNIDITMDDTYLVVRNNRQEKQKREQESPGIGLANIKARYEFLSDLPVVVEDNTDFFEVKIPVIREAA